MLTVITRDYWTLPDNSDEDYNEGAGASRYSCYAFTKEDLAWLVGEGPKAAYKWEAAAAAGKTLLVAPTAAQKAKLEGDWKRDRAGTRGTSMTRAGKR
jgi:hypothetical protein